MKKVDANKSRNNKANRQTSSVNKSDIVKKQNVSDGYVNSDVDKSGKNTQTGHKRSATGRDKHHNKNSVKGALNSADISVTSPISKPWMIPLVLAIAVVPLIMMLHFFDDGLSKYSWSSIDGNTVDVYLYYKSICIRFIGAVLLFILVYFLIKKDRSFIRDRRNLPPLIAAGLFGLLVLLSSIFSKYATFAFWGIDAQFEGCFVLLSYVVLFIFAFGYVRSMELIRFLLDALMIGAIIIGLLGFLEYIGVEWTVTDIVKKIISIAEVSKDIDTSQINADTSTMVASTLYNSNYVGSYVPLVLPYCIYNIIKGKGVIRRILGAVASLLLLITLYASKSDAGMIAMAAGIVVTMVLVFPFLKIRMKVATIGVGIIMIAGIAYVLISTDILTNLFPPDETRAIENMENTENGVIIDTSDGKHLRVTLASDSIYASDGNIVDKITITDEDAQKPLTISYDESARAVLSEEGYAPLLFFMEPKTFAPEDTSDHQEHVINMFHINDNAGHDWTMLPNDGKMMYFDGYLGKFGDFRKVQSWGFENKYTAMSGRGYIWSRVFPLLKKYIVLGSGPDTFTIVYPNDDFVGRANWGFSGQITTRPHNVYLQIWLQDGLIAMVAFIFLYVLFIVRVLLMCYVKRLRLSLTGGTAGRVSDPTDAEGMQDGANMSASHDASAGLPFAHIAIVSAIGISAYMVAGIANDSIVCIAPVFWTMLGVGYAAESMAHRSVN